MSYQQPPYDASAQPAGVAPPGGAYGVPPNAYGAPGAYAQQGYGPQPGYGPQHGYGPQAGYGNPFVNAANASGALVMFAGISAALPILERAISMARLVPISSIETYITVEKSVDALVHFVTIILFFVWIYRLTTAIRATQGTSAYSPGWTIGWWFVPFANFVMPYFTLSDAWKRTMQGDARGWVVPAWWGTYIVAMICSTLFGLEGVMMKLFDSIGNGGVSAISWLWFFADLATWSCMLLAVRWITERTAPQQR
jgi:hypothetical protein